MTQVLYDNPHYRLAIDPAKNRLYITIIGFWRQKEDVADYIKELALSLDRLQPGFTLLTDLRAMKAHPLEVMEIHIQAQRLVVGQGLLQTAEVFNSSLVQFQTQKYSDKSSMKLKQFASIQEAELYLDEKQAESVV